METTARLYSLDVDDIPLLGGIANAGAVVRSGKHVLRPTNPHTNSVHRLLVSIRSKGFRGVPHPLGVDPDGRERLVFIEGDVPLPPYPAWSQTDEALASMTELVRSLHDASVGFPSGEFDWNDELADPNGGDVMCHNDVCLENVVFRDGRALALLDFDFAAPGRRPWDLAAFARLCVPIDDPTSQARLGWQVEDGPDRLRLIADTYGLDTEERVTLIDSLDWTMENGGEFVRRKVEANEPGFMKMWEETGGMERYERRRRWWLDIREKFVSRLTA